MPSCQDLDAIAALAFSGVSAACRRISQQPSTGVPGSAGPASSAKESRLLAGDDATEWSPPRKCGDTVDRYTYRGANRSARGGSYLRRSQRRAAAGPGGLGRALRWQPVLRAFSHSKLFWRGSSAWHECGDMTKVSAFPQPGGWASQHMTGAADRTTAHLNHRVGSTGHRFRDGRSAQPLLALRPIALL